MEVSILGDQENEYIAIIATHVAPVINKHILLPMSHIVMDKPLSLGFITVCLIIGALIAPTKELPMTAGAPNPDTAKAAPKVMALLTPKAISLFWGNIISRFDVLLLRIPPFSLAPISKQ